MLHLPKVPYGKKVGTVDPNRWRGGRHRIRAGGSRGLFLFPSFSSVLQPCLSLICFEREHTAVPGFLRRRDRPKLAVFPDEWRSLF